MHLFSFLFRIFADNMQILLASAKIMNDKVNVLPDFTMSTPAFRKEAESFARDMAQYSTETIAEMLGCSHQIAAQNRLRFMRFFEGTETLPAILAYHGQAYKHLKCPAETLDHLVPLWPASPTGRHSPLSDGGTC